MNSDGLQKVLGLFRFFALVILATHVYWVCYSFFKDNNLSVLAFDKLLSNINQDIGLYRKPIYIKLFALVVLIFTSFGRGKINPNISWIKVVSFGAAGLIFYFGNFFLLRLNNIDTNSRIIIYAVSLLIGFLLLIAAFDTLARLLKRDFMKDRFNFDGESFLQTENLMTNKHSINLPTAYYYEGKQRKGYINVVNPFRAIMVLGTPGSGKSFAVINPTIKQHLAKGFSMYIYDFKFDDLSIIAYNHWLINKDNPKIYKVKPQFYVLNFDNPRKSHRCNPIHPLFMTDISDAYESAYVIMLNLNKTWIQKQGDFFVESPIILLAAIIWYLKLYENGKYCTFPHVIEFLNKKYTDIFPILTSYAELENYLSPFMDAWEGGAQDQLQGQIASAKIPLSRMISPQLYWVMSGNDFTLDLNNPKQPKILCIGNNPDRQNIYSAALGLYNSRVVKTINQKKKLPCSVIIDELPTMYFRGLDNLIATARSNKVSVCLGFQDFTQLIRDYGKDQAQAIISTVGNLFSGLVTGETAESISKRFGKIKQRKESYSINKTDTSVSLSEHMDSLIPASKISTLSQGSFVGVVSDDFGQRIKQKFFNAEIMVDIEAISQEEKAYKPMPEIRSFIKNGVDCADEIVTENYRNIKTDVENIVQSELERIKNDPNLAHLIPEIK